MFFFSGNVLSVPRATPASVWVYESHAMLTLIRWFNSVLCVRVEMEYVWGGVEYSRGGAGLVHKYSKTRTQSCGGIRTLSACARRSTVAMVSAPRKPPPDICIDLALVFVIFFV